MFQSHMFGQIHTVVASIFNYRQIYSKLLQKKPLNIIKKRIN